MSANTAEKYKFDLKPGSAGAGAEAFLNLLVQSEASLLHATEKLISPHSFSFFFCLFLFFLSFFFGNPG